MRTPLHLVLLSSLCLSLLSLPGCGPAEDPRSPELGSATMGAGTGVPDLGGAGGNDPRKTGGLTPSGNLPACADLSGAWRLKKDRENDLLEVTIRQKGCTAIRIEAERKVGTKRFSWTVDQDPVKPESCIEVSVAERKGECERHRIDRESYQRTIFRKADDGKKDPTPLRRETWRLENDGSLARVTETLRPDGKTSGLITEKLVSR
jgi:hypothetical protein